MQVRLTNVEIVQISKLLDTIITKDENGVRYAKPWNDARVAKKFGVKNTHIKYLRQQVYGKLAIDPKPKQLKLGLEQKPKHTILNTVAELRNLTLAHTEMIDRLTATVGDIKQVLVANERRLSHLEGRMSYLERELGITRQDNSEK